MMGDVEKKEEKRIGRKQQKKESVLFVEDLGTLSITIEIWKKRDLYRGPQINLKY